MKITLSRAPLTPATLARMAGGTLVTHGDTIVNLTHICTDSREADGQTLLCAFRGERVDGHTFLPAAARAGCVAFLCERLPEGWETDPALAGAVAILVDNTEAALGWMSAAYRKETLTNTRVVAITGSVGKTTTKEMVAAVLAVRSPVFKKEGNYNSTIGLPLSVMEIDADTPAAVLEMGMSQRGEIQSMTQAVEPDIAIIANVGSSHLEHLGTRENIARAKLEIAQGLDAGGILLINGDEPLLAHLGQDFPADRPIIPAGITACRVSLAGAPDADYTVTGITPRDGGMCFDLAAADACFHELWVPAPGEHMCWAGAFAAVVGLLCGLTESEIRTGLAAYRPAALRQSVRTVAGVTFIEDCYNAAPESMIAALGVLDMTWRDAPIGRRVAVLGDMRELGDRSLELHRSVGRDLARRGVDHLFAVGELGAYIATGAMEAGMTDDRVHATEDTTQYEAFAAALAATLHPGDCVLFKASRAMALETLSATVARLLTDKRES